MPYSRDQIRRYQAGEKLMAMPDSDRIAKILAKVPGRHAPAYEPGLESPTGQRILQNLAVAAGGYGMGNLGGSIATALAQKAAPALGALGEAGAVFPEGTPPSQLPEIPSGAKTGDPHALFAYQQKLGPEFPAEDYYNLFGDKDALLKMTEGNHGFGSSVTADTVKKYGIPIIGKQAQRVFH